MTTRSRPRTRALVAGLIFAAIGMTCAHSGEQIPQALTTSAGAVARVVSPAPAFAQAQPRGESQPLTVADVAERAVPSVVNISATKVVKQARGTQSPLFNDPFFRQFFGQGPQQFRDAPQERRQRSLGSGVIVSADGIVLTNNHVIEQADEVEVSLADGREFDAKIIGADPKSDVAVLRLEGDVKDLQPLEVGDSAEMRLGEVVIAIGNPFGVGQTVTMGIVSAVGRGNMGIVDYEDFIQTDAAINPGNSGGALVNMRGQLIGINTAILSRSGGYQGIGFAIPSNLAMPVMESLVDHGKVIRGFLGVTIQDLSEDLAKGLSIGTTKGVLISDVGDKTPAAGAGFKRGDVIVKMNGKVVTSTSAFRNAVALAGPNAKAIFEVLRAGKRIELDATLGELPADVAAGGSIEPDGGAFEGATLGDLDPAVRQRFDIASEVKNGVVVTEIEPGSRAERAGLREGDVILEVNQKRVGNSATFRKLYDNAKGTLLLLVQRQSSTIYLAVKR